MRCPVSRTEVQRRRRLRPQLPTSRRYVISYPFLHLFISSPTYCSTSPVLEQDFRQCQKLIQRIGSEQSHAFPPSSQQARHDTLAAKNVQRGLAAKVQELSTTFRKKQRVYMESMSQSLLLHRIMHLIRSFPPVIQSCKAMRSRIRTCSSHQAPYLPKAQRGCRLSTMTWKLLSVFVPVPVQRTELFNFFVHRLSALKSDINSDRRCHARSTNARSRVNGDSQIHRGSGGAIQGFECSGYRPGNFAR
jgi:hypothetical protein